MTIFISDTHFGRVPGEVDREIERDLIACIESLLDDLDALYLVGDIFEHFIEYRNVVPKGSARFQGMLARLTDSGLPVRYVVGNHDPWHRDYFETELGVELSFSGFDAEINGLAVHVAHGDGLGPKAGAYRYLKPILRHPLPVTAYRSILPADLGMSIAKWYGRTFRSEEPNEARTQSLRTAALDLLKENPYDLVVMGHSHVAELISTEWGTYVNCGCWYSHRTLAVVNEEGPSVRSWHDGRLTEMRS